MPDQRETSPNLTMSRIFDNINQDLLGALRATMQVSKRADFCVGYLNLRGWQAIDDHVSPWQPALGQVCRVLVPNPPNVDAGEGVPMMFAQMEQAKLYEPLYREQLETAVPTLVVTLLNEERPPLWVQVSDWIDRSGPITNSRLREMSGLDTLAASKQLKQWVGQGVLVALPAPSRQQASYTKPELADLPGSLSLGLDNET